MRFRIRPYVSLVVAASMAPAGLWALEAVVQSGVGAGSAVAGSMGAMQAQIDALQANQTGANLLINQQAAQLELLRNSVSTTERLLQQIINTGSDVSKTTGTDPSSSWHFKSEVRSASSGPRFGHPPTNVVASCHQGEQLLGGGGFCTTEPDGWGYVYMTESRPYQNGWKVSCDGNGITPPDRTHLPVTHAYAVCGTLYNQ